MSWRSQSATLTRLAASMVLCGLLSRRTQAVLEPGSLVPACAAASAPLAVRMSATYPNMQCFCSHN